MSRNAESRFSELPNVDISRSKFNRCSSVKTSFNVGELIPFYVDEVLPGDTFQIDTSKVVRLQTMLTPMMDNLYLDTYYFYVPNRLVWEHWRELNGENTASAWTQTVEYSVPQLEAPSGGWNVGTIADYFGIPTGVDGFTVNAMPFRMYAMIVNEWFRDENLQDPLAFPVTDATVTGSNGSTFVSDVAKGGTPWIACKYHDYFTSCLPAPQKGPDVSLPLLGGDLPVITKSDSVSSDFYPMGSAMKFSNYSSGVDVVGSTTYNGLGLASTTGSLRRAAIPSGSLDDIGLAPRNLWASTSEASMATINQLRLAFQIQKLYERDARGGTRYVEILKSHFGVTSPDSRLQRPEYLGGNRIPINVNQVLQQSGTVSGSTPQGTPTGLSVTTDNHSDFTKSFVEHGFVIGLMVARYDHTYQQGLERMWSRKTRFDYYWPVFANIGEQAVLNKEIFLSGTQADDEGVFGYQEAWADYRYKPNRVSGEMRSAATTSLDVWHLADDYAALPSLSDAWIQEDKANVDRVLAVTSAVSNQLFADMYIKNTTTRPMPVYSIPGLIDHH